MFPNAITQPENSPMINLSKIQVRCVKWAMNLDIYKFENKKNDE